MRGPGDAGAAGRAPLAGPRSAVGGAVGVVPDGRPGGRQQRARGRGGGPAGGGGAAHPGPAERRPPGRAARRRPARTGHRDQGDTCARGPGCAAAPVVGRHRRRGQRHRPRLPAARAGRREPGRRIPAGVPAAGGVQQRSAVRHHRAVHERTVGHRDRRRGARGDRPGRTALRRSGPPLARRGRDDRRGPGRNDAGLPVVRDPAGHAGGAGRPAGVAGVRGRRLPRGRAAPGPVAGHSPLAGGRVRAGRRLRRPHLGRPPGHRALPAHGLRGSSQCPAGRRGRPGRGRTGGRHDHGGCTGRHGQRQRQPVSGPGDVRSGGVRPRNPHQNGRARRDGRRPRRKERRPRAGGAGGPAAAETGAVRGRGRRRAGSQRGRGGRAGSGVPSPPKRSPLLRL